MKNTDVKSQSSTEFGFLSLGSSLRILNLTAKDHIDLLIPEVNEILEFCKANCKSSKQIEIYEKFVIEFNQRRSHQSISYEYWIILAFRISILITDESKRTTADMDLSRNDEFFEYLLKNNRWETHEGVVLDNQEFTSEMPSFPLKKCIDLFPLLIMIPGGYGEISISHLNQGLARQIYPLRLIQSATIADGQTWYPDRFIRKQLIHANNFCIQYWDSYNKLNLVLFFVQYCIQDTQNSQDASIRFGVDFLITYMLYYDFFVFYDIYIGDDNRYRSLREFLKERLKLSINIYTVVEDDNWFGKIIKANLPEKYSDTKSFINHMIDKIDLLIKQFFQEYDLKNFTKYTLVNPGISPTSDEVDSHWTKKVQLDEFYTKNEKFMTWLVKNDKSGPEKFDRWSIFLHIASKFEKWSATPCVRLVVTLN